MTINSIREVFRNCPYCGERIALDVDTSAGDQAYTEDCSVCCQPILVRIHIEGSRLTVDLEQENN